MLIRALFLVVILLLLLKFQMLYHSTCETARYYAIRLMCLCTYVYTKTQTLFISFSYSLITHSQVCQRKISYVISVVLQPFLMGATSYAIKV